VPDKTPLDIKIEVAAIKEMYNKSATTKYLRAIIFGDIGTGKTYLQRTCPRPIHVDSFDPGGAKTNRACIDAGWMIADTRYEDEDPKAPVALDLWAKEYIRRRDGGYYEYFGTYCLDSLTMFSKAAMNAILKRKNRTDGIPKTGKEDNDYILQMGLMEPILRDIFNLPCHVIITAHPDLSTDEDAGGKKIIGPQVTGQLRTRLPLMCDEIYCSQTSPLPPSPGQKEPELKYRLLTKQDGLYRCRSRLASTGIIGMYEDQDIKKLLRKAGLSDEDKPIPWLEK
jgi:hypothetical protein